MAAAVPEIMGALGGDVVCACWDDGLGAWWVAGAGAVG